MIFNYFSSSRWTCVLLKWLKWRKREDTKCFRLRCKLHTVNDGVNDYKKKVTPQKELCCLICFVLCSVLITSKVVNDKVERVLLQILFDTASGFHVSRWSSVFTVPGLGTSCPESRMKRIYPSQLSICTIHSKQVRKTWFSEFLVLLVLEKKQMVLNHEKKYFWFL